MRDPGYHLVPGRRNWVVCAHVEEGQNMTQEKLRTLSVVLFLIAPFILASCISTNKHRESIEKYIDQNIDKLYFDNWGAPSEIRRVDSGKTLWIYRWSSDLTSESTSHFSPTYQSIGENGMPAANQHLWCKTVFEINEHNKIIDAEWEGNYCTSTALGLKSEIMKNNKNSVHFY